MKTRQLQARLKKLEARLPPPPPTKEEKLMQFYGYLQYLAIGYYLGNPQPYDRSDTAAFARALGFEHVENYYHFQHTSPETIEQRWAPAVDRLLAKFGLSRSDDKDTVRDAYKRMAEGFSEPYKELLRWGARHLGIEWPFA
jgi:hypothetical protein